MLSPQKPWTLATMMSKHAGSAVNILVLGARGIWDKTRSPTALPISELVQVMLPAWRNCIVTNSIRH